MRTIRRLIGEMREDLHFRAERIRMQVYAERVERELVDGVPADHDYVRKHGEFDLALANFLDAMAGRSPE